MIKATKRLSMVLGLDKKSRRQSMKTVTNMLGITRKEKSEGDSNNVDSGWK